MQKDVGFTSARTRARMVERLRANGIQDEAVLSRMNDVRRHVFLESAIATQAYDDRAVPIGFGQTMSQPWVVARMTELALNGRTRIHRALDIGCGSGYHAAILAGFADQVLAIERIGGLIERARAAHVLEGIDNIRVIHGDGFDPGQDGQKYDVIMVAAAPKEVPQSLLEALAEGGRLVLPVGDETQRLVAYTATGGRYVREELDDVRFVPMLPGTR